MNAGDVMTRNVVTVSPDTTVPELVKILLSRNISGVPVVDNDGTLVGIVTEGDLVRRSELGTERKRGGWLAFFTATATMAQDYVRSHGTKVSDLMTPGVVAATRDTPLAEVADMMEERHVRRVPVVEDGKVIGIVSRADLVRAIAAANPATETEADDVAIHRQLLSELRHEEWAKLGAIEIAVRNKIVHLFIGAEQPVEERQALRVAAENTPGVRGIEEHILPVPAMPVY
jgi:CBS domain-containing protein